MTQDWYEKPTKPKAPTAKWLRLVLVAIVCGVLTGILVAFGFVLHSYIFPKPSPFSLSLDEEAWAAVLVMMFGATLGLIIGTPTAIIFGPLAILVTEKLEGKLQYISRIGIGVFGAILAFLTFQTLTHSREWIMFSPAGLYMPISSGIIGSIIFMKLYSQRKPQQ